MNIQRHRKRSEENLQVEINVLKMPPTFDTKIRPTNSTPPPSPPHHILTTARSPPSRLIKDRDLPAFDDDVLP